MRASLIPKDRDASIDTYLHPLMHSAHRCTATKLIALEVAFRFLDNFTERNKRQNDRSRAVIVEPRRI